MLGGGLGAAMRRAWARPPLWAVALLGALLEALQVLQPAHIGSTTGVLVLWAGALAGADPRDLLLRGLLLGRLLRRLFGRLPRLLSCLRHLVNSRVVFNHRCGGGFPNRGNLRTRPSVRNGPKTRSSTPQSLARNFLSSEI